MALIEEFDKQGNFLFRWRSYVPGCIILFCFLYLPEVPYFQNSYDRNLLWLGLAFFVSSLGLLVRCFVIGYAPGRTSGRNTKQQVADLVNQTGIYSLVRHPLYLGNFLIYLGPVLILRDLAVTLVFGFFFWVYYERIMFTEEFFLRNKFGEEYLSWANRTPAFFPQLQNYQKPTLPFSFRNVLKREYPSLFGMIVIFTVLDLLQVYFQEPQLRSENFLGIWKSFHSYFFGFGFAFYCVVRLVVKTTKWLHVPGR